MFRRSTQPAAEVKVYLSNAPQNCPKSELTRVCGMRWPVESAFEEAKGELGMDHYEVRTWRGWHHHMTQTFLAHHFLVRMRLKLKKAPALTVAQAKVLVASVLGRPNLTLAEAIEIVHYHQQRNYAAYRSHRKRTLTKYRARGFRPKNRQVSL